MTFFRTEFERNEALAIVVTPEEAVLFPTSDALLSDCSCHRVSTQVLFYDPDAEEPRDIINVRWLTPEAVLEQWAFWVEPPFGFPEPRFTMEEREAVLRRGWGAWRVCDEPEEWAASGEKSLTILLNVPHLHYNAILGSLGEVLDQRMPGWRDYYRLVWEMEASPMLCSALLLQHYFRRNDLKNQDFLARRAVNRDEMIRNRADADRHWLETLLPLSQIAELTRRVFERDRRSGHEFHEAWIDAELTRDDPRGRRPSAPRRPRRGGVLGVEELLHEVVDSEESIRAALDPERIRLLESLRVWEERYPEIQVERALQWIDALVRRGS